MAVTDFEPEKETVQGVRGRLYEGRAFRIISGLFPRA